MITITKIPPITALSLKMRMTVHKTNIRDADQITNLVVPKFKQELFAQTSTDFNQPEQTFILKLNDQTDYLATDNVLIQVLCIEKDKIYGYYNQDLITET